MDSVEIVDAASITEAEARLGGYESVEALRADLRGDPVLPLHRLAFRRIDEPDPRAELAADAELTAAGLDEMRRRLARLDAGAPAPWTLATLELIRANPGTRAADLAARLGLERFKTNVRKLKALGLTLNPENGYRLSPRGEAFLGRRDGT